MNGSPALAWRASAPLVLASCMRLRMPSYIRAPPEADTMMTGNFDSVAFSMARVTFSPTTEPMLAPRNEKSITAITTSWPLILHKPVCTASRSEEHTSELQSRQYLVCRLLLEKKKKKKPKDI